MRINEIKKLIVYHNLLLCSTVSIPVTLKTFILETHKKFSIKQTTNFGSKTCFLYFDMEIGFVRIKNEKKKLSTLDTFDVKLSDCAMAMRKVLKVQSFSHLFIHIDFECVTV